MGCGRVVAVGGEAVTEELGENGRAELARHLLGHQHEHPAPLAEREPLSVLGVGRGRLRGERLERVEARVENARQRLRAAGEDGVGLAVADELARVADRVRARRARGVDGDHRALQTEGRRKRLCECLRRREEQQLRVRLLPLVPGDVPPLRREQPGVAGADHDAPALGRDRLTREDTAVRDGLLGRLQREVDHGLAVAVGIRVLVLGQDDVLDLAAELRAVAVHRQVLHLADHGPPAPDPFPERLERRALGRDRTHPCHDDPPRFLDL